MPMFWLFSDLETCFKLYLSSLQQDKVLKQKTGKSLVKRKKMEAEDLYRVLLFKFTMSEMIQDNFIRSDHDDFRYWKLCDAVTISSFSCVSDLEHHSSDVTAFFRCLQQRQSPVCYRFLWEICHSICKVIFKFFAIRQLCYLIFSQHTKCTI